MPNKKVVIIGLDGADWRLLNPWIQNGDLPTLSKLVSEGTSGNLRSTIRPESSVAWSSFSTGVNPGKHGIFGFAKHVEGSYAFKLANGSHVRVRRFWDLVGEHGSKVGLLNIPFTYPPTPVNGFLITGMLTPGTDAAFAYPRALEQQLIERFGGYTFDAGDSAQEKSALIDKVHAYTYQQRETACTLLQEQPWDLFAMVFTGPDRLQHFLWADMDSQHPFHTPQTVHHLGGALLEHYQMLDDAIAKILDLVPSDTIVFLMSDHGFNGCAQRFYVNQWLQEQGLLTLREANKQWSSLLPLLSCLKSIPWIRRLKRAFLPDEWSSTDLRSGVFARSIDWSCTKAYFGLDGGLRINLHGREPEGIVPPDQYDALRQELRQTLLGVTNPATGHSPISSVFLREELYHGEFTGRAPDMILEPERESLDYMGNFVLDSSLNTNRTSAFGSSLPYSGNHALDGIFVAWGADMATGQPTRDVHIIDIVPTVLAIMGVAVPDYMDGRVLSEMFLPGRVPIPHRITESLTNTPSVPEESFDTREEKVIESRLRNLGYLD